VNFSDPFGLCILNLPCPQGFVDAVAGFGDAASFGLSGLIRRHTPGGDGVNYSSGMYTAGAVAGTIAVTVATSGIGEAREAADGEGIVYRRINPETGEEYIGRSNSEEAFVRRQAAHDSNLGVEHEYEVVGRAKNGTPLRVAEESAIRKGGGPGRLANRRYEMNEDAYRAAGGTVEKP
jgi:hypothetical protein